MSEHKTTAERPLIFTLPGYQPAAPSRWLRRPDLDCPGHGAPIAWEIMPDAA